MFLTAFPVECSIDYSAFDILMNYIKSWENILAIRVDLYINPCLEKKPRNAQNEPSGWADYIFFLI